MGQRGRRAPEGARGGRLRRAAGRALAEGARRHGARTARGSGASATRPTSPSTRPGSTAGLPVSIVKSFAAPPAAVRDDAELFRERIGTTATSLLGLLGIEADPLQSREHILLAKLLEAAWREGRDLDLAALIQQIQSPPIAEGRRARPRGVLPGEGPLRAGDPAQQPPGRPGLRRLARGRAARHRRAAPHARRQAPRRDLLDRAPVRRRAHVLRLAAPERDARLDAGAVRHDQPAGAPLHGRDLRLLPAGREPAVEAPAPDAPQAGAGVRRGRGARDPEPGRPRLQGARQHRDVVHRAAPDGARQGARARRPGGRGRRRRQALRPRDHGEDPGRPREPGLPPEQRARGRARGLRVALGDVLPARPADPGPDQAAHGRPAAGSARPGAARRRARRPPRPRPPPPATAPAAASAAARGGAQPVLPPGVPQHFVPVRGSAPAGATLVYQPMVLGAATVRFADTKAGVDQSEEVVVATADHGRRRCR